MGVQCIFISEMFAAEVHRERGEGHYYYMLPVLGLFQSRAKKTGPEAKP